MTALHTSHHNGSTTPPVAKWPKIKSMGKLNGCCAMTKWPYNFGGVSVAFHAFKGQCNWVVGLRHGYYTCITPLWLHNTPCGQMAKNQNNGQPEWMSRNNHMTIQLQRCSYYLIFFQSAIHLSGWSKSWLLYMHHTIMASHSCGQMAKK
jgi:hypothetical protein